MNGRTVEVARVIKKEANPAQQVHQLWAMGPISLTSGHAGKRKAWLSNNAS
ncbi:MAG: hypothetical protein ACFCD0_29790 [Gemmataceae bacterium]